MRPQRQIVIATVRVASGHSNLYATWCAGCGKEVDLVTFADAARIVGASVNEIVEQAADGKIHLGVRPEALLVCLDSLLGVDEFSFNRSVH